MFNGASSFIESVDGVFLFTIIVSVFFLVLITALMIGFVIKYNRKKNPKAVNIKGNAKLRNSMDCNSNYFGLNYVLVRMDRLPRYG